MTIPKDEEHNMNMIVGNDISHFQGNVDWSTYAKNSNFVILEVTEGTNFTDPLFIQNQAQARTLNIPIMYYHFARPDARNAPEDEASYFLKQIGKLQEGEALAVDFEVNFPNAVAWLKDFLDFIVLRNGVHPMIYLNKSEVTEFDWTEIAGAGYGLWLADYNDEPVLGAWKFMAMRQWTNQQMVPGIAAAVDGDYFYGTVDQFKLYGYHAPQVPPTPVPVPPVSHVSPSSSVSKSPSPSSPPSKPYSPSRSLSASASPSASPSPSEEIPTPAPLPKEQLTQLKLIIADRWNWFGAKGWYNQLAKLRKIING